MFFYSFYLCFKNLYLPTVADQIFLNFIVINFDQNLKKIWRKFNKLEKTSDIVTKVPKIYFCDCRIKFNFIKTSSRFWTVVLFSSHHHFDIVKFANLQFRIRPSDALNFSIPLNVACLDEKIWRLLLDQRCWILWKWKLLTKKRIFCFNFYAVFYLPLDFGSLRCRCGTETRIALIRI